MTLSWAMRGLCLIGFVAAIVAHNWTALAWVIAAFAHHERAERAERFLVRVR